MRHKLEFVLEENRFYRALIDRHSPRWRLQDAERKRLAEKGKHPGKLLGDVITIVKLETLLKWHRHLIASKGDSSRRRKVKRVRPPVSIEIEKLVLQLARENPSWVYDRTVGALTNLGHQISDQDRRQYSQATRIGENEMERRSVLLDGTADGTNA